LRKPFIFQLPATSFFRCAIDLLPARRAARQILRPQRRLPIFGHYHHIGVRTVNPGRNAGERRFPAMLQAIRSKAGSRVVKGLFVVLIATFGVWGIGDIFRNR